MSGQNTRQIQDLSCAQQTALNRHDPSSEEEGRDRDQQLLGTNDTSVNNDDHNSPPSPPAAQTSHEYTESVSSHSSALPANPSSAQNRPDSAPSTATDECASNASLATIKSKGSPTKALSHSSSRRVESTESPFASESDSDDSSVDSTDSDDTVEEVWYGPSRHATFLCTPVAGARSRQEVHQAVEERNSESPERNLIRCGNRNNSNVPTISDQTWRNSRTERTSTSQSSTCTSLSSHHASTTEQLNQTGDLTSEATEETGAVGGLGVTQLRRNSSLDCAICLQACMHPARLPCTHIFCFLCLKGFAQQSQRCAMCRAPIPPDYLDRPELVQTPEPSSLVDGYQWFYEGRNGWWQYDERTSQELEEHYQAGERLVELLIAGNIYMIDFTDMVQYRKIRSYDFTEMVQYRKVDTIRKRRIKRDMLLNASRVKGIAGLRLVDSGDVDNPPLRPPPIPEDHNYSISDAQQRRISVAALLRDGDSSDPVARDIDDSSRHDHLYTRRELDENVRAPWLVRRDVTNFPDLESTPRDAPIINPSSLLIPTTPFLRGDPPLMFNTSLMLQLPISQQVFVGQLRVLDVTFHATAHALANVQRVLDNIWNWTLTPWRENQEASPRVEVALLLRRILVYVDIHILNPCYRQLERDISRTLPNFGGNPDVRGLVDVVLSRARACMRHNTVVTEMDLRRIQRTLRTIRYSFEYTQRTIPPEMRARLIIDWMRESYSLSVNAEALDTMEEMVRSLFPERTDTRSWVEEVRKSLVHLLIHIRSVQAAEAGPNAVNYFLPFHALNTLENTIKQYLGLPNDRPGLPQQEHGPPSSLYSGLTDTLANGLMERNRRRSQDQLACVRDETDLWRASPEDSGTNEIVHPRTGLEVSPRNEHANREMSITPEEFRPHRTVVFRRAAVRNQSNARSPSEDSTHRPSSSTTSNSFCSSLSEFDSWNSGPRNIEVYVPVNSSQIGIRSQQEEVTASFQENTELEQDTNSSEYNEVTLRRRRRDSDFVREIGASQLNDQRLRDPMSDMGRLQRNITESSRDSNSSGQSSIFSQDVGPWANDPLPDYRCDQCSTIDVPGHICSHPQRYYQNVYRPRFTAQSANPPRSSSTGRRLPDVGNPVSRRFTEVVSRLMEVGRDESLPSGTENQVTEVGIQANGQPLSSTDSSFPDSGTVRSSPVLTEPNLLISIPDPSDTPEHLPRESDRDWNATLVSFSDPRQDRSAVRSGNISRNSAGTRLDGTRNYARRGDFLRNAPNNTRAPPNMTSFMEGLIHFGQINDCPTLQDTVRLLRDISNRCQSTGSNNDDITRTVDELLNGWEFFNREIMQFGQPNNCQTAEGRVPVLENISSHCPSTGHTDGTVDHLPPCWDIFNQIYEDMRNIRQGNVMQSVNTQSQRLVDVNADLQRLDLLYEQHISRAQQLNRMIHESPRENLIDSSTEGYRTSSNSVEANTPSSSSDRYENVPSATNNFEIRSVIQTPTNLMHTKVINRNRVPASSPINVPANRPNHVGAEAPHIPPDHQYFAQDSTAPLNNECPIVGAPKPIGEWMNPLKIPSRETRRSSSRHFPLDPAAVTAIDTVNPMFTSNSFLYPPDTSHVSNHSFFSSEDERQSFFTDSLERNLGRLASRNGHSACVRKTKSSHSEDSKRVNQSGGADSLTCNRNERHNTQGSGNSADNTAKSEFYFGNPVFGETTSGCSGFDSETCNQALEHDRPGSHSLAGAVVDVDEWYGESRGTGVGEEDTVSCATSHTESATEFEDNYHREDSNDHFTNVEYADSLESSSQDPSQTQVKNSSSRGCGFDNVGFHQILTYSNLSCLAKEFVPRSVNPVGATEVSNAFGGEVSTAVGYSSIKQGPNNRKAATSEGNWSNELTSDTHSEGAPSSTYYFGSNSNVTEVSDDELNDGRSNDIQERSLEEQFIENCYKTRKTRRSESTEVGNGQNVEEVLKEYDAIREDCSQSDGGEQSVIHGSEENNKRLVDKGREQDCNRERTARLNQREEEMDIDTRGFSFRTNEHATDFIPNNTHSTNNDAFLMRTRGEVIRCHGTRDSTFSVTNRHARDSDSNILSFIKSNTQHQTEHDRIIDSHDHNQSLFDNYPRDQRVFDSTTRDQRVLDSATRDQRVLDSATRDQRVFDSTTRDPTLDSNIQNQRVIGNNTRDQTLVMDHSYAAVKLPLAYSEHSYASKKLKSSRNAHDRGRKLNRTLSDRETRCGRERDRVRRNSVDSRPSETRKAERSASKGCAVDAEHAYSKQGAQFDHEYAKVCTEGSLIDQMNYLTLRESTDEEDEDL